MCGRYAAFREAQELAREFDVEIIEEAAAEREASWNVAPTDGVRVILDRAPKAEAADAGEPDGVRREMHLARWALLPPWAKDLRGGGAPLFNARIETVAEKPAFKRSLRSRRCLVPADGYFEWRTDEAPGGGKPVKTPFFIHAPSPEPDADPDAGRAPSLAFAGLYSWWRDPSRAEDDPARWVLSATVLTQPARDGLEAIHDREPVVLAPAAISDWLDPSVTDPDGALAVLAASPPPLVWHEVGSRVGSVRNNDPGLIAPL